MKVTLEKTFPMPASADIAWSLLQNIRDVAACMPGAAITEQLDATHYKGTVAVKFGPASLAFRGEIEVAAVDAATKTLRLVGKGTDTTGGSGASMDLTARIDAIDAASCNLLGSSEVSMSGKAAAFGGRMMGSVADQILKQFAGNFASKAQAAAVPPPSGAAPQAVAAAEASTVAVAPAAASTAAGSAAVPAVPRPPAPAAPPAAPNELNALALIWAVFKDWLRSLFGAKRA